MADTEAPVAPGDVTEGNSTLHTPHSLRARLATDDQAVSPEEGPETPHSALTEGDEPEPAADDQRMPRKSFLLWLADRNIELPRVMTEPREPVLAVVDRRRREIDQQRSGWRWWIEMGWVNSIGGVAIFVLYLLAWVQEDVWRSLRVTAATLTVGQILHLLGGQWIPMFLTWQFYPPFCWIF